MDSIAARYNILLKDRDGELVAFFDQYQSVDFERTVNDQGSFRITFRDNGDERLDYFSKENVDYLVEIKRAVPGCDLDWYTEFYGLFRTSEKATDQEGQRTVEVTGFGYNNLLARRVIAYRHGTVQSDKDDYAEDCMKEYVYENCGADALEASGRSRDAVWAEFSVDAESAEHDETTEWSGSKGFASLLDALQDIANFSLSGVPTTRAADFQVEPNGDGEFIFKTYLDQLGTDRRYGEATPPVVFSVELGNCQNVRFGVNRSQEANAIIVLGKGESSTQTVVSRENAGAGDDSPWNDIEISRPSTNSEFEYQLEDFGDAELENSQYREEFSAELLQSPGTLYGLHYFLGDLVTFRYGDIYLDKKITTVRGKFDENDESLSFEFGDIP